MPRPLTRRERSIRSLYAKLARAEDRAKQQYSLAHSLTLQIARKSKGQTVRISESKGILAVDQFVEAVKGSEEGEMPEIWAHGAVRQFKIKEVPLPAV